MTDYRPTIPAYTHDTPLFTFEDAVESLLDSFALTRMDKHLRVARRAIMDAYRDLPDKTRWPYLRRRGAIATVAPQTTGTIVYDHSGGTYEREVTLTGATWPTDARYYGLLISDVQYKVEAYKSSTVITLTEDSNPGADVASTAYQLFRSVYPLPTNFRRGSRLFETDGATWPRYVSPSIGLQEAWLETTPAEPWAYTIRNAGEHYNSLAVEFYPPPSTSRRYEYVYEAIPRPLFYEKYQTGTVSVSSTTVTGSGTSFDARMVGSVIRFPDNATNNKAPTGLAGSVEETNSLNPYVAERVVTAVASTTSLTIDATVSGTVSASRYTISDPIDISHPAMLTVFKRMCEENYARYTQRESLPGYISSTKQALVHAKEAAQYYTPVGEASPWLHDYPIGTVTDD